MKEINLSSHLSALVRAYMPEQVAKEFTKVQPINLDPATQLYLSPWSTVSGDYIDETWMLINGYRKEVKKLGCTGLLEEVRWVKDTVRYIMGDPSDNECT